MPEKPTEVVYTPNQLYVIKVIIKDLDYTNDIIDVTFTSSLSTAYQVIDITFSLDPTDIIVEDIFGGEPIKLTITLTREQGFPGPSLEVDLMYLTSNFEAASKEPLTSVAQKVRTPLRITTIARHPFKTMSSLVNDVFIGSNLNSIISSLANDVGTTINYDTNGQNKNVIDQVCIPPMSFYKIIKEYNKNDPDIFDGYLDQRFGLFSGTPGVFCQYDNKVYIKNLTSKISMDQAFTVYQLALDASKNKLSDKIYEDSDNLGTVFYTYDGIQTSYSGNARFADVGTYINQVVRPKDTITSTLSFNLDTIASQSSLFYSQKNKSLYIDEMTKRSKYYIEDTGFNTDSTQFLSRYGRSVSDLSSLSINLERNLPILNLINVGECVKFKPSTIEYQDFEGKYILWSSVLKFIKQGPIWASTAQINLNRTNKKN
jgi:hypothetical protein